MCNLYSMLSNKEAIRAFSQFLRISPNADNLPAFSAVNGNDFGPIVRNTSEGRELAMARWGMPTSPYNLKGKRVDGGVVNVRNTDSRHWQPWLGVANRCIVPFTSFTEFDQVSKVDIWYGSDQSRPLQFFAGIWLADWTSTRRQKEGPTTSDLFAFLTAGPSEDIRNANAMPVILRMPEEVETWLTAPTDEALRLQRSLPEGSLQLLARATSSDGEGINSKDFMTATPAKSAPPAQPSLF